MERGVGNWPILLHYKNTHMCDQKAEVDESFALLI